MVLRDFEQGWSSAYHSKRKGKLSSTNATLKQFLEAYVRYQQIEWVSLLLFMEYKMTKGFKGNLPTVRTLHKHSWLMGRTIMKWLRSWTLS